MKQLAALLCLLAALLPGPSAANDPGRPRVGLALSGGGARGAAHIGVLRVLEEMRIPVDYVAGTSMGAIIGGLYASGMSADEIEKALAAIDWSDIFDDSPPRVSLSVRRKTDGDRFLLDKQAGVRNGALSLPTGIITGQKLYLELRKLTLDAGDATDFGALPIPFRCVATDIADGQPVVLSAGDLAAAIRASMAVPAVFAPVDLGGARLVDGGISNNMPIDIVREMGAEVVIAVDVSTPLLGKGEIDSVVAVAEQLSTILTRLNTERQLASLTPGDFLITPDLEDFGSAAFEAALQVVDRGRESALEQAEGLGRLSLDEEGYRKHLAARPDLPPMVERLAFVEIENRSTVKDSVIRSRLGVNPGDLVDITSIESGIASIYGLDIFESVTYSLESGEQGTGLMVTAGEKPWGPDYLQLGLEFDTDLRSGGDATISLGHIRLPTNDRGGEWRSVLRVGQDAGLVTELYQPFDQSSPWFTQAAGLFREETYRIEAQGGSDSENQLQQIGGLLSLGRNFGSHTEIRLDYRRFAARVRTRTGLPIDEDEFDGGELSLAANRDTLDSRAFPRHGHSFRAGALVSRRDLGADAEFDQFEVDYLGITTHGPHSWRLGLGLMASDATDPVPITNQGRLGGLFRLPGYRRDELRGPNLALVRAGYMRTIPLPIGLDVHAGFNLQAGNVFEEREDIESSALLWSGAAWFGSTTPLGPVYFGYGVSEDSQRSLYILLGAQF